MTQEFAQAPVVGCKRVAKTDNAGSHAKVYFTKHIDAEHLIKLYDLINESIYGKIAIKLHTGEKHGPNILPRELVKALQQQIPDSTIVETNTLYQGDRYTTEEHLDTLKVNGWTFCPVDIMDAEGTVNLPVRHGKHFKEVSMGKNIVNYDSMLVLTHFKGHAMGGFGGSMKNLAIGCADEGLRKRLAIGKIPCFGLEAALAVVRAAADEKRHPDAKTVCDVAVFDIPVVHGVLMAQRCRTRSRISSVRPWFQNWVPM